jgi:hypothetical protein
MTTQQTPCTATANNAEPKKNGWAWTTAALMLVFIAIALAGILSGLLDTLPTSLRAQLLSLCYWVLPTTSFFAGWCEGVVQLRRSKPDLPLFGEETSRTLYVWQLATLFAGFAASLGWALSAGLDNPELKKHIEEGMRFCMNAGFASALALSGFRQWAKSKD